MNVSVLNLETFASLRLLMTNLECERDNIPDLVTEIKLKCEDALMLIDDLRFKIHSDYVQLATKHAVQFIDQALAAIKAYTAGYNPLTQNSTVAIEDICSPVHAGLEIILNLENR